MKAVQATSILLKPSPDMTMSYMKLIKLLYIADRESIKETRAPITGDRPVAMPHGPVLSSIYDFIMKRDRPGIETWEQFFETAGIDIVLLNEPGTDELCPYEVDKLREIAARYADHTQWDLRDLTHEFDEWKRNDPGHSSQAIPLEHIIDAVGLSNEIDEILQDREDSKYFASIFQR